MSTAPRQRLNARQKETLDKLFVAGKEVLEELGHTDLSIRLVAQRAGVSTATAYTYIASKDHLFAELFAELLREDPGPVLTERSKVGRLEQVTRHLADLMSGSPALAAAANKSLLGSDPEVARLRLEIGQMVFDRFREALGDGADPDLLLTISFAFSGAVLQAGMGMVAYDDLGDVLARSMRVILKGHR